MTVIRNHAYYSPEDYLELEKISPVKHEYIQGEVYAMAGGSDAHNTIALNLLSLLRNHVRGTACRVFSSDMKVRETSALKGGSSVGGFPDIKKLPSEASSDFVKIEQANIFYYPDGMVTCDTRDRSFQYFKKYPCLIIEVLSPATGNFDRSDKFSDYQLLDTLQEYVLISQECLNLECFYRDKRGNWKKQIYQSAETIELKSVDFRCPIEQLYEDVEFNTR